MGKGGDSGRRVPELDGLRGVAVLLVVAGHSWSGVFPTYRRLAPSTDSRSGLAFLGVTLFFVLSGYLITSILVREHQGSGHVDLRSFYSRRARRLLPALVVAIVGYSAYGLAVGHQTINVLGTAFRSLFYIENFGDFMSLPTTGWLGHTWSLAVEQHFYLVWPLAFVWAARKGRDGIAAAAILGAVTSMLLREVLMQKGVDPYGLMHWDALMFGCVVAVREWKVPRIVVWLTAIGVTLQIASYLSSGTNASMTFVQYVGFAAAGAVFVLHASRTRWLNNPVLRHLGMISYGLYLWHVLLLRTGWPIPIALLIAITASEASYYGIERKFVKPRRKLVAIEHHVARHEMIGGKD